MSTSMPSHCLAEATRAAINCCTYVDVEVRVAAVNALACLAEISDQNVDVVMALNSRIEDASVSVRRCALERLTQIAVKGDECVAEFAIIAVSGCLAARCVTNADVETMRCAKNALAQVAKNSGQYRICSPCFTHANAHVRAVVLEVLAEVVEGDNRAVIESMSACLAHVSIYHVVCAYHHKHEGIS